MYQNAISFAGAGRVAEALCKELFHAGFRIDKIVSETKDSGTLLADACSNMVIRPLIWRFNEDFNYCCTGP